MSLPVQAPNKAQFVAVKVHSYTQTISACVMRKTARYLPPVFRVRKPPPG